MHKVKAEPKPTIKDVWAQLWREYKREWKDLWEKYKSVIIPFVKGTFAYVWQLVYGLIKLLAAGLYGTGKIILERLLALIKKA